MKLFAIVFLGVILALGIGIWMQARSRKGTYRPLSKVKPKASEMFLKTIPTRNGDQYRNALPGLNKQRQKEHDEAIRHKKSAQERKEHDARYERQQRIRPWDNL